MLGLGLLKVLLFHLARSAYSSGLGLKRTLVPTVKKFEMKAASHVKGMVMSQQLQQFPKVFVFTLISKEQHEIQVLPPVIPGKRNNSHFQGAAR